MGRSPEEDHRHFVDQIVPWNEVWVAVREEQPVGFLAMRDGQLNYLYVDPRAQRGGVGSALLERAKERMPGGLALFTHRRNDGARRFYEARDFRAVAFGISPAPELEPDVRYEWAPMTARSAAGIEGQ
jgi:GNAT superfamily N-acetyltransferase